MNRKDIGILSFLILLLMAWTMFGPVLERKLFPPDPWEESRPEAPPATVKTNRARRRTDFASTPGAREDCHAY